MPGSSSRFAWQVSYLLHYLSSPLSLLLKDKNEIYLVNQYIASLWSFQNWPGPCEAARVERIPIPEGPGLVSSQGCRYLHLASRVNPLSCWWEPQRPLGKARPGFTRVTGKPVTKYTAEGIVGLRVSEISTQRPGVYLETTPADLAMKFHSGLGLAHQEGLWLSLVIWAPCLITGM